eukprot:2657434-Pyramimonas_sp.AAC.1
MGDPSLHEIVPVLIQALGLIVAPSATKMHVKYLQIGGNKLYPLRESLDGIRRCVGDFGTIATHPGKIIRDQRGPRHRCTNCSIQNQS